MHNLHVSFYKEQKTMFNYSNLILQYEMKS